MDVAGDGGMGMGGCRPGRGTRQASGETQPRAKVHDGEDGTATYSLASLGKRRDGGRVAAKKREQGKVRLSRRLTLDAGRSASGRLAIDLRVLRASVPIRMYSRYVCVLFGDGGTLVWRRRATG